MQPTTIQRFLAIQRAAKAGGHGTVAPALGKNFAAKCRISGLRTVFITRGSRKSAPGPQRLRLRADAPNPAAGPGSPETDHPPERRCRDESTDTGMTSLLDAGTPSTTQPSRTARSKE